MAQYHQKAEFLKPEVLAQNFTPEQMTTILKMMRGCIALRQTKPIISFLECMLPENMKITEGDLKEGKYGQYRENLVTLKEEILN